MVMTVTATEAGIVSYVKRPGAVVEPGMLLAHLELDDPALAMRATEYLGGFPTPTSEATAHENPHATEKLNQQHSHCRTVLENILAGKIFLLKYNKYFKINL